MAFYIRVWQPCDPQAVTRHLLVVGDLTADCANCRELGIDYAQARQCPKCGTGFHFIAARSAGSGAGVRRIKERRPDLTFIDYHDYKEITGKQQARDFFK